MEKLPMCRICLAENIRMYVVVNRNLHELYEKLTDIPFVTEDRRPILVCFFCFTKLKQCYQLLRKCLEAEELFSQMMNEDYEPNPLINQNDLEFFSGFIISPIVHISIVDECETEGIKAIKEELPAACEALDVINEPNEEYKSDELEPTKLDYSCLDVAEQPHYSESDLEDDEPLMKFKSEVEEEQEVSKKKRRASETKRVTVAKKPKLDTRRTKLKETITAEQTKNDKSDSKVNRTTQKRTSKPAAYLKEHTGQKSYKCDVCQRSFSRKNYLTKHSRVHTGVLKPFKCDVCQSSFSRKNNLSQHILIHTGEKPFKCDVCQRSFSQKSHLTYHRRQHTGEKPYQCDVCQHSFTRNNYLTTHIRQHTGEKPFKCDLCERSFSRKDDLSTHIRQHTADKPFKCHVCQCSFSKKASLTQHIRIHTVQK